MEIEPELKAFVEAKGLHFMGGIHALEHAAIGIFPLFALCDRNDIGGICYPYHPQVEKSAVFIYDGHPGGVGLAQHGFDIVLALLEKTREHVGTCECEEGCPSCIHSPKCGSGNKPLDKKAALLILDGLLGRIPLSEMTGGAGEVEPAPVYEEKKEEFEKPSEPRIVYLDVETQKLAQEVGGWQNTHLMRISVAILYDDVEKDFKVFMEDEMDALFEHLEKAALIVGFNIMGFDYKVLGAYTNKVLFKLPTFDMLADVHKKLGFRLSLDHLAQETLNTKKTADGLQAVAWFRKGEMEKIIEYCKHDVAVTRDLFQFGLENGHLIYRKKNVDRRLRLPVDWNLNDLIV
jgi:DEAD/DEAH box helicase domain-containing protein